MIKKLMAALCIIGFIACHGKKEKNKNSYKTETFFDTFQKLRLPYLVVDTAMIGRQDAVEISRETLKNYIPDTLVEKIIPHNNAVLHPIGRIDVEGNRYLIVASQTGTNSIWYALAFSDKNKYIAYLPILKNKNDDSYQHSLSINAEPTFMLGKRKKDGNDNPLYTNEGFAFSSSAHRFTLVINDTNENLPDADEVFVPIDTLPQTFPHSGNYRKNKQNILVLRDGLRPNEYKFYYHFDKTDDDPNAKGEIKGTIKMVSPMAAIYQQGGDPCVIDFNFREKGVKIKEEGNCANYRGSNVQFDENFEKVKSLGKKEPATNPKKK